MGVERGWWCCLGERWCCLVGERWDAGTVLVGTTKHHFSVYGSSSARGVSGIVVDGGRRAKHFQCRRGVPDQCRRGVPDRRCRSRTIDVARTEY
jgi:hypothetical protein